MVRLEEQEIVGRLGLCTVRSHLVLCCNMSPRCVRVMGVCRALALFGDAKHDMGEGKSGPVETRLTGLGIFFLMRNRKDPEIHTD